MPTTPEELAKMSKSKYGKVVLEQPNKFLALIERVFLRTSLIRSYVNGGLTVGAFVYWLMSGNPWPMYLWVSYLVFVTLLGWWYWRKETKRLDKEIKRCEDELRGLGAEIAERKAFFDKLRLDMEKNKKN